MPAATLLNVNDEPPRCYVLTRAARRAGFDVIEAETGTDAIAKTRTLTPDVVLLDVKLPDVDGVTVCREIDQEQPADRRHPCHLVLGVRDRG